MSTNRKLRVVAVLAIFAFMATIASAQAGPHPALDRQGIQKLVDRTGGEARVSVDPVTGAARFVRLPSGSLPKAVGTPREKAMAFLREYGSVFGVTAPEKQLQFTQERRDALNGEHVTFRQVHDGLPVFGAEIRAHFRNGELFAVNGTFLPGIKVRTPGIGFKAGTSATTLSAEEASELAIRAVLGSLAKREVAEGQPQDASGFHEEDYRDLAAVDSTLMMFRSGLVQGVAGRDYLVYKVEVRNEPVTIREFVFVDANDGRVIDQITGIRDGLNRRAYDAMGTTAPGPNYPGSPFWVEGDPFPTGTVEADNMIYASGETYNLFWNAFGRDSFDDAGATMDAIFNRGNGCPNASWNGIFISFCPGLTTDDVTAHEWGHAFTEYTNDLIYSYQSGALNESFSDIRGETVDLINGRGTDSPGGLRTDGSCSDYGNGGPGDNSYRWLMGEDVNAPGLVGAIRDMWNPTCYGDPGKVSDAQYYCSSGDNGGVHFNSGVPNHGFALMTDGGTYNGYTITGLGLTKANHIHWAASLMLTPSSNFADHADSLDAACASLIGVNLSDLTTGLPSGEVISVADCDEVDKVNNAVEFRTPPTQCGFETVLDPNAPALCDGLGTVQTASFEDFEGGSLPAGWSVSSHDVANPGTFDNPGWSVVGGLPSGGSGSYAAFVPDLNQGNCGSDDESGALSLDSPAIALPVGVPPRVAFDHWVATEAGWDGGNVKVSVNGGSWQQVPSSAYAFNAYNDVLNDPPGNTNPLASEEAFTGTDEGTNGGSWGQSQIELIGLAQPGDSVRLRFDFGVDGCFGVIGWYVDDVHVYSCSDEPLPICGDGELDPGETCDDGNADPGDGCSSTCQVEDGWICSDPMPAGDSTNVIGDFSFESGYPNTDWTPFSTFGGLPGFPLCGPGNGCPASSLANTGSWLVWIGGLSAGVTSTIEQDVTIPPSATDLTLLTWRGICDDASDTLHIQLDGNDIGTQVCDATDNGWQLQTYSVAGYNDGGTHTLLIGGTVGGTNGTHTNFFVEDVILEDNIPTPPTPSVCTEITSDLSCNTVVGFDDGLPDSWTVLDNTGLGLVWSNIAGSGEPGNYTGGAGDAASVSSDVYGPADFDTELRTNSFSLAGAVSGSLDYLVNYQNFAAFDFLDLDISTDGGANWTTLLSWNEDHGGFRNTPGVPVSINLAPYLGASDVQLRWRYYDPTTFDWDWYAQVDNVQLTCNRVPDCDGATASPSELWSPDHQFVPITIDVTDPDGDPVTVIIDSIYQDEEVDGTGSGDTGPDGQGVGTTMAEVRAERDGNGNGRVYHISFTASDGHGGVCSGEALVGVPHDQSGGAAVDDGALYDSTQP